MRAYTRTLTTHTHAFTHIPYGHVLLLTLVKWDQSRYYSSRTPTQGRTKFIPAPRSRESSTQVRRKFILGSRTPGGPTPVRTNHKHTSPYLFMRSDTALVSLLMMTWKLLTLKMSRTFKSVRLCSRRHIVSVVFSFSGTRQRELAIDHGFQSCQTAVFAVTTIGQQHC